MPYTDDIEETQGVYSKRLPDREGFFWVWNKKTDEEYIIEIIASDEVETDGTLFWKSPNTYHYPQSLEHFKGWYFYGPIRKPLKLYAKPRSNRRKSK